MIAMENLIIFWQKTSLNKFISMIESTEGFNSVEKEGLKSLHRYLVKKTEKRAKQSTLYMSDTEASAATKI